MLRRMSDPRRYHEPSMGALAWVLVLVFVVVPVGALTIGLLEWMLG